MLAAQVLMEYEYMRNTYDTIDAQIAAMLRGEYVMKPKKPARPKQQVTVVHLVKEGVNGEPFEFKHVEPGFSEFAAQQAAAKEMRKHGYTSMKLVSVTVEN